ncbi:retinaldehyde-binding protein 1-like [Contarinia nasturtii]|uniref:retinaldehyde-binding protein 1-like n=1 Tax=Contarinia nasturtii TaxID=265458 RepID=UPI0012D4A76A|nr:retinaldehyde-binding protein 1-like [Contarinia nasturtii]
MISMPKLTKEGYQVLIYRLIDNDPSKINFADAIKGFCMFNDIRLSEDLLAEGYIVIFDMKGIRLGHISRVSMGPLRSFMSYIQNAHPARLKSIWICHAASFVNQVMSLVKPLIKSELMSLLHFTTKGPQTIIDKDLLPESILWK